VGGGGLGGASGGGREKSPTTVSHPKMCCWADLVQQDLHAQGECPQRKEVSIAVVCAEHTTG